VSADINNNANLCGSLRRSHIFRAPFAYRRSARRRLRRGAWLAASAVWWSASAVAPPSQATASSTLAPAALEAEMRVTRPLPRRDCQPRPRPPVAAAAALVLPDPDRLEEEEEEESVEYAAFSQRRNLWYRAFRDATRALHHRSRERERWIILKKKKRSKI